MSLWEAKNREGFMIYDLRVAGRSLTDFVAVLYGKSWHTNKNREMKRTRKWLFFPQWLVIPIQLQGVQHQIGQSHVFGITSQ